MVLTGRLRSALGRLNPRADTAALGDALRQVLRVDSPSLVENNRASHRMLTDAVPVPCRKADGTQGYQQIRLLDYEDPESNDFLAVNHFSVLEGHNHRRPDIVIFINGLPIAVCEMKNPADEKATAKSAFNQLQTYKQEIPSLFQFNELLVVSDGLASKIGSLTANWEWFLPWRTADGATVAPKTELQLKTLVHGVFDKARLLDLIRYFAVFDTSGAQAVKKVAAYHKFGAVNKAVECTVAAALPDGDRRAGVIWHTQGIGKSLSMAFYAGKLIQHPAMENPTVVVLTDRNDLDDQLFGTFSACQDLLRQKALQAENREHVRELLRVVSGGAVFTTMQKFFPGTGEGTRNCPTAGTWWSSPTKRIGASMTSSTASPGTCATHCRMLRSSGSRGRRLSSRTRTPRRCLATTSTCATCGGQWKPGRRCRSTTRRAWRRSSLPRQSGRSLTKSSRRSPRIRNRANARN